jgi:hypothetical protein
MRCGDRDTVAMDEVLALTRANLQFIEAFRVGSWALLEPLLSPSFRYLDGATGETWELARYIESLRANPLPRITIDQMVIHIDGDVAAVSARSSSQPGRHSRYLDSYHRSTDGWKCFHACVWPLGNDRHDAT